MAEAQPPQLRLHVLDIRLGRDARVRAGLHRVLLGRQAERVETHRVQHIGPVIRQIARVDVGGDEAERVTDVQPGALGYGNMSSTNRLGRSATWRGSSASRPVRLGVQNTCSAVPAVLPRQLDPLGERRVVPVLRDVVGALGHMPERSGRLTEPQVTDW